MSVNIGRVTFLIVAESNSFTINSVSVVNADDFSNGVDASAIEVILVLPVETVSSAINPQSDNQ